MFSYSQTVSAKRQTEMNLILLLAAGPAAVIVYKWSLVRISIRPKKAAYILVRATADLGAVTANLSLVRTAATYRLPFDVRFGTAR